MFSYLRSRRMDQLTEQREQRDAERTKEARDIFCAGKKTYPTYKAAMGQQKYGAKFERKGTAGKLQPYQCKVCHAYHLGTTIHGGTPVKKKYARRREAIYDDMENDA